MLESMEQDEETPTVITYKSLPDSTQSGPFADGGQVYVLNKTWPYLQLIQHLVQHGTLIGCTTVRVRLR